MKHVFLSLFLLLAAAPSARAATTFEQYQSFPRPAYANGAFVVTGAGLPDGRLLVWDGDNVYTQFADGSDRFERTAHGYQGDTAFVALSPDGHTALLGQGYAGNLYRFDTADPADYSPASVITNVPGHYSGVYLNDHLVLLDVGRLDFSGSELQIIDLDTAKNGAKALPHTVITKGPEYANASKSLVVDKPPFAYSSSLAVDNTQDVVYAMDANTRELRFFSTADLITAFNTATPLDWAADGTLVGSIGQFFSGGVSGVQPNGNIIVGGSSGFLQPGGIQVIDPSLALPASASVVDTLDPTGNQDYYYVIYNAYTDVITGVTFSGDAYAPNDSFTPVPIGGYATMGLLCVCIGFIAMRGIAKRQATR